MYGVEGRENKKAEKNEKQRSEEKNRNCSAKKKTEIFAAYIGCHAKIAQLLLNNHSPQRLSATFVYLNFLTNVLKII